MMRELNIFFAFIIIVACVPACSSFQQEPEPEFYEKLRIDPIELDIQCIHLPENLEDEECVMIA